MAFSHTNSKSQTYHLHTQEVKLKGGRLQRIYYFSKDPKGSIDKPEGFKVLENKRTGLPFLKREDK